MKQAISFLVVALILAVNATLCAQSSVESSGFETFTNPDISSAPVDVALHEAAPHLPWIKRTEGNESVFTGQRFNYELVANQDNFRAWADEYPDELRAYKIRMPVFFAQYPPETFKGQEQDFYYDIKAQYDMIAQLQGWTE